MKFSKLEGAGNDFIVIETNTISGNWKHLARVMCDRHFGIGGDGLILFLPSEIADIGMRMFNPDGSEAEACGNGLRCIVKYASEMGLVDIKPELISIETLRGIRQASVSNETIRINMGPPIFDRNKIPVNININNIPSDEITIDYPLTVGGMNLNLNILSMGNPHAVQIINTPVRDYSLATIGPQVENHPTFPKRTNFEITKVVNKGEVDARVWERGVGETLACGTGACAIVVTTFTKGLTSNRVVVNLPGGKLDVDFSTTDEVWLGGPAELVFQGEWKRENRCD
jgi:diaminopimelate epimerase